MISVNSLDSKGAIKADEIVTKAIKSANEKGEKSVTVHYFDSYFDDPSERNGWLYSNLEKNGYKWKWCLDCFGCPTGAIKVSW